MNETPIRKSCPNCDHQNDPRAEICINCGEKINTPTTLSVPMQTTGLLALAIEKSIRELVEARLDANAIAFVVSGNNEPILGHGRRRLFLGRRNLDQPQHEDELVDLTWYFAHALGVSRKHAIIEYLNQAYYIQDLGSTNGTRVNGERLRPLKLTPLESGDRIQVAKLTLFVYFKSQ